MTVTIDQQIGEGNGLECSESVATSISSRDKKDEEMEDEVISDVVEGTEGDEIVSESDIDKVNMEGEVEKKTEGEDAVPAEMEVEPSKEGETTEFSCAEGGDNDISVVISDEGVVDGSNDKEGGAQPKDVHQAQEAELEAYLESLKPKPKRKSIKEMLMAMPGYKDISFLKPKIGGSEKKGKKDVIILDEVGPPGRLSKRQQQIEELKDRFVKHALVAPPKPMKEEHIKLKIKKKEEDSQGIEHLVENVVDYVRNPLNEEEEARSALTPLSLSTSPQGDRPGAKYTSLRKTLLGQIRMKKLKKYEERVKSHKENNEIGGDEEEEEDLFGDGGNREDDSDNSEDEDEDGSEVGDGEEQVEDLLGGPGPEKDENIVANDEAEDEDDSEVGEEEEEELEDVLDCPSPEKKDKNIFVDDEAEDEDEDGDDVNDDDEYDEDNSDSDSEFIKNDIPIRKSKTTDTVETESIGDTQDSDFITPVPDSKTDEQEEPTSIRQSENENSTSMDFSIDPTPKVATTFLNPATPSDFWIPATSSVVSRQPDGLSPLIPRIHRNTNIMEMEKEISLNASVPDSLVNVISETKTKFDDLVDLCSGKFVTQQPSEPSGIQEDDDEFGNFDYGDDDDLCEDNNEVRENSECVKTPVAGSSRNAVNGITPKLATKPTISRRSMQFEIENTKDKAGRSDDKMENSTIDSVQLINTDDEDGDGVVTRRSTKRNKRLQFSDDEDDDNVEIMSTSQASEDEQSDKDEGAVQVEQEPPQTHNPWRNKYGKLKRKYVEDEAELSGSEEGSGDEDERGLNDYEMEEGDEEDLDEDQVRDQVGRTHMKITHDDDDRRVRYLQNRLLKDGDLGGDTREKTRRFFDDIKNGLVDDARMGNSDEEEQEETSEELLKKTEWIEKRKWISENSHLLETDADESQSLLSSIKIGRQTLKRIESFVDTSTSESKDFHFKETSTSHKRNSIWEKILETRKAATKTPASGSNSLTSCSEGLNFSSVGKATNMSMDESSKSMTEPMFGGVSWTKNVTSVGTKGSFLSRGGMMFAKLAETSKTGDAVSNVKNNSRNFVFSHITPPNPEKTDGSTSKVKRAVNKGGYKAPAKKIKVDRSFHNLDETSKQSSVFQFL